MERREIKGWLRLSDYQVNENKHYGAAESPVRTNGATRESLHIGGFDFVGLQRDWFVSLGDGKELLTWMQWSEYEESFIKVNQTAPIVRIWVADIS